MTDYAVLSPPSPALSALAEPLALNDVIAVVNVSDTSTPPASAAGSNQAAKVSQVGAAYGLVFPSGDTSGVTDTAAINALAQAGKAANCQPGTYYVTNLLPDSYGTIIGQGLGVAFQAAAGTTGAMIALKTPASTVRVTIANVRLIPNTGSVIGISLDNTALGSGDPAHQLTSVYVDGAKGDAFKFGANIRSCKFTDLQQYNGQAYGFNVQAGCTDNFFTDCLSGASTNHGFYVNDSNNIFTGCKAFFAGYNGSTWGTTQAGFYVNGTVCTQLIGCQAQQNALNGFDLQGCSYITVIGCDSDSNSAGTSTGVGINTNGVTNGTICANTGYNNTGLSPQAQKYGYQAAGTQTGTLFYGNTVTGSSGRFNYVSGFGYSIIDGSQADFSQVSFFKIPSAVLASDSAQALTSSGTILTATHGTLAAIPVTETGNVTGMILEAPQQAWSQVTIINQSAFTITFAASGTSHVADGVLDVIPANAARTFVYDGNTSLWYRAG